MDFLYGADVVLFTFLNGTLSNPVGDFLWPFITDWDRFLVIRILLVAVWLGLIVRGGKRGRIAAVLVVLVVFCADQLSSSVIKPLVQRPRPCHVVDGAPAVPEVHLLVHCGGGKSFPSSHAVNTFAVATLFAFFYHRWRWALFGWAAIVSFSRVAVGVHYPSDILGGALIGLGVGWCVLGVWMVAGRFLPGWARLSPEEAPVHD